MSRQTLYVAAINNTDGKATLDAIAAGGGQLTLVIKLSSIIHMIH